jgi:hypothetical protein
LEIGFSKNEKVDYDIVEHLRVAVPALGSGSAALFGLLDSMLPKSFSNFFFLLKPVCNLF